MNRLTSRSAQKIADATVRQAAGAMRDIITVALVAGSLHAGSVRASDMFAGWTKPAKSPSLRLPGLSSGISAELLTIRNSTITNKTDRGCSDSSFGSHYSGLADEVFLHSSTGTFAAGQTDALQIAVTNHAGPGGTVVFDTVMTDSTAPFGSSPEILQITYKEGGLGLAPGTVLGLWTNTPGSGLTGYDDYEDFDADLTVFPAADRTLFSGQYAVFEITVSGGTGATYIDNIAVNGTYHPPPGTNGTIAVTVDPSDQKWRISDRLIGLHCEYHDARDSAYADGRIAGWAASNHIAFMRYPGGSTVKTYDWQNPSGTLADDPWDPAYTGAADATLWMSLDEYLAFCDAGGARPMIGINWLSGSKFRTLEEGVERASNCVQYVKNHGYPGADYYIGNEDMWELCLLDDGIWSIAESAGYFVQYAQAMKAADPDIRIFWNDNDVNTNRLRVFLSVAGDWADGVEFHSKWPEQGEGDGSVWSCDDWKNEFPLIDHARLRSHRDLANTLRSVAAGAGYPNLLMANNEYGVTSKNYRLAGFDRYTINLVVIDFLQELFIGNYDASAFWDNAMLKTPWSNQTLFNPPFGNRFNPSAFGLEMLSPAQGAAMLGYTSSSSNVYGFAAATDDEILLYLINKTESEQNIEVAFDTAGVSRSKPPAGLALVDTIGQWGANQAFAVGYHEASGNYTATLPPMSYNRLRFAKAAHQTVQSLLSGNWTNAATWSPGEVPDHPDLVLIKSQHVVAVDSTGNEAGSLRLDGGQACLDILPGGSLEIVNSGNYPTNGAVSFKEAESALGIRLQGGSLTVGGNFTLGAGGSGITNLLLITAGSLNVGGDVFIGTEGGGDALMDIIGASAGISVGGDLTAGSSGILRWTASEAGAVTPVVSANAKSVTLGGALAADLSAMTNSPPEIILIDHHGGDALLGAFSSAHIVGASGYSLSYTGGDGNDLSLIYTGTAYDTWAQSHSLAGGPADDDDGDSLSNLGEYGLNGNPTNSADRGIRPILLSMGGLLEYIYARRTAPDSGLTYYLELTDDLVSGTWTNGGYIVTGTGTIHPDFEAVTNRIQNAGKTKGFIRLRIIAD